MARRYGKGIRDKNTPVARMQRWIHEEITRELREAEERWFQRHVIGSGSGKLLGVLGSRSIIVPIQLERAIGRTEIL
jgi:hypothetical protein